VKIILIGSKKSSFVTLRLQNFIPFTSILKSRKKLLHKFQK